MRNIFLFIKHFFNFFLFIILLGCSFAILIKYNKTYEAVFANTANEITGWVDKQYNTVEYYFRLKQTNEQLAEENARLYSASKENFESADTSTLIKIDSVLKDTLGHTRKFIFLPAKVVNNSVNDENNYITLYRGSKQGAVKDMGVIGPDGIVGKVILVSDNYCRVMSLLNHYSKVSAMLKKGFYTGLLDWDGANPQYVTLHGIPKSVQVRKGDTVLTSNLSGNFPAGMMIGTIAGISSESASNFYTLQIKTATNFYSLQFAYLVQNMMLNEQKQLEAQTPKNQ